MEKPITYVGLDVHKDTIAVALAEMRRREEVREHGKIAVHAAPRRESRRPKLLSRVRS